MPNQDTSGVRYAKYVATRTAQGAKPKTKEQWLDNGKNKAFHANGGMTAAEYKRRFLNKKAVARGTAQVEVRTAVAFLPAGFKATAKDKARLRNVTIRQEPNPGNFFSSANERAVMAQTAGTLKAGRAVSHIRTSF